MSTAYNPDLSNVGEVARIRQGTIIGSSGWKLALDMEVELEYTGEYVIATNSWIDEYGHGDTREEAIEDLLISLVEFRDSLECQNQRSQLAEELLETLDKLNILLIS